LQEDGMDKVGHDDVVRLLGELDDEQVAEILGLSPSLADLERAAQWLAVGEDERPGTARPPTGIAAAIVDIVGEEEDEDDGGKPGAMEG